MVFKGFDHLITSYVLNHSKDALLWKYRINNTRTHWVHKWIHKLIPWDVKLFSQSVMCHAGHAALPASDSTMSVALYNHCVIQLKLRQHFQDFWMAICCWLWTTDQYDDHFVSEPDSHWTNACVLPLVPLSPIPRNYSVSKHIYFTSRKHLRYFQLLFLFSTL